ncbi:MAG: GtrA family protein [bacterium]|nr:GtrA family protein [bacterium]
MDKWYKLPDFIRFLIIGGVNAAISYVIFVIAILIFGKGQYQLCVALQWILSSVPSYLNQKFFVFCTKGNYVKEYLKCCSTWIVSYFLNVIFIEVFVRYLIKEVFLAQLLAIFTVSLVTYVLFKVFAFKK